MTTHRMIKVELKPLNNEVTNQGVTENMSSIPLGGEHKVTGSHDIFQEQMSDSTQQL